MLLKNLQWLKLLWGVFLRWPCQKSPVVWDLRWSSYGAELSGLRCMPQEWFPTSPSGKGYTWSFAREKLTRMQKNSNKTSLIERISKNWEKASPWRLSPISQELVKLSGPGIGDCSSKFHNCWWDVANVWVVWLAKALFCSSKFISSSHLIQIDNWPESEMEIPRTLARAMWPCLEYNGVSPMWNNDSSMSTDMSDVSRDLGKSSFSKWLVNKEQWQWILLVDICWWMSQVHNASKEKPSLIDILGKFDAGCAIVQEYLWLS